MVKQKPMGLAGYRMLFYLLSPLLIFYTAWQALHARSWRYLLQRLGMAVPIQNNRPLWIHAASVGEVKGVLPLLEALQHNHPDVPLVLTTLTSSGGQMAKARLPDGAVHCFLPIDWPGAVNRFLSAVSPRCALIMETELWPTLYTATADRKITLLIINGRLSVKTLKAPPWLRNLYSSCMQSCRTILARSEQDRTGFIALGAQPEQVVVIGNIKFSSQRKADARPLPELQRRYVLAASTRDNEERPIVEAWLSQPRDDHLLVIAPRHPKRLNRILSQLRPLLSEIAVRSRGEAVTETTELYIADTFGELPALIAGAELVFMGGSLVNKGGQNLLEPAAFGKPVITGPHMENFSDETRLLLAHDGIVQITDKDELATTFTVLLADPQLRKKLGENASAVVTAHQDMVERYLSSIEEICNLQE
jgi:3-deoxy-D-manno-octulosonic-acid transferase